VDILNFLLDQNGSDEDGPLADLVNIVGTLISEYEQKQYGEFAEP
jgi:hypothetical protein